MAKGGRSKQSSKPARKRRGGSSKGGVSSFILDRSAGRISSQTDHHVHSTRAAADPRYDVHTSQMSNRWLPPPPPHARFAEDYRKYRNDSGKEYSYHDVRYDRDARAQPRHHGRDARSYDHERSAHQPHNQERQSHKEARHPRLHHNHQSSDRGLRAPINHRSRPKKALATHQRRRNSKRTNGNSKSITLQPIKVKQSGIMTAWKKSLGGLIRYYVHKRTTTQGVDQKTAEEEIDQMYYRSGCGVDETKNAILKALGVNVDVEEWVGVDMAIVKESASDDDKSASDEYTETIDGKGLILKQVVRAGEGPAHKSERWNTVVVPQWALGKSYYFQVRNNTPLDLSCELFLDGEQVAFNAPLNANSTRTIRPDGMRYYQRHEWILNEAKRVKLGAVQDGDTGTLTEGVLTKQQQPVSQRYNGIRPDYQGKRVSFQDYPDPTAHGWTFTGSVEASYVEFFEKKMNNGGLVKLDFYYTTGTIKTVLDHPTSGRNQLFRALVTPEQYKAVLDNPRVHTDQGYRRSVDRPVGDGNTESMEEEDEFDKVPIEFTKEDDANMEDNEDKVQVSGAKFYARDVNYDFKVQGHQNRQAEMDKLQHDANYVKWKEANKREYAVIHAKFYVSTPQRMYRAPPKKRNGGRRNGKQMDPLPVPEQAPVVDVKAAEKCTLGTNYVPCAPQTFGRSNVRMERINGLTDEKQWKGDPLFEKKLYYRAESIINGSGLENLSEDDMSEDEGNTNDMSAVELAEYKAEKVVQVEQYHLDLSHCVLDEEEAEQLLRNAKNKIHLSASKHDVDESVNLFYQDLVYRQFLDSNTMCV
jgi:hypothetical protein